MVLTLSGRVTCLVFMGIQSLVVHAALSPNEPRLEHGSSIAVRNERARREAA
jgi:hypothetical protein